SCCVTLVFPQPADTHDTHRCLSGTAVPARIERPSPIQMILPSVLAFSSRQGGLLASHWARPTGVFQFSISLCLPLGEWPRLLFAARIGRGQLQLCSFHAHTASNRRVACLASHCARPTSTFRACA